MAKTILSISLVWLLILSFLIILPTQNALAEENIITPEGYPVVDPQVWQSFSANGENITFIVKMGQLPEEGFETAIPAQFRIDAALLLLQERNDIQSYLVFYGDNVIKVSGNERSVRLLAGWPEVSRISLYNPGESWELRYLLTQNEFITATGHIVGHVTSVNGTIPLEGIKVTAYFQTGIITWMVAGTALTNSFGNYDVSGLAAGIYRIKFEDLSGNISSEYYDNQIDFLHATNITHDGVTTNNINASLEQAGKISGIVTKNNGGNTLPDIVATAWRLTGGNKWSIITSAVTNTSGVYTLGGLLPGNYRIQFSDSYNPPRYVDEYFDNVLDILSATDVPVSAGITTLGINAALGSYGKMTGRITAFDGITPLDDISIDLYIFNINTSTWEWYGYGASDATGNYEVNGLTTGNYRVEFNDLLGQFKQEYYDNKFTIETAQDVHVDLGATKANINASLELATVTESYNLTTTGQNLISLNAIPFVTNPKDVLTNIAGKYNLVWAYDGCTPQDLWKKFDPTAQFGNTLVSMNTSQGYWIEMTSPGILSVTGTHPLSTNINLCTGWNLIGYPSLKTRAVTDVFQDIAGKYSLVYAFYASDLTDPWKKYNPSSPVGNDLTTMSPWYGYWILMKQPASLTIPGR